LTARAAGATLLEVRGKGPRPSGWEWVIALIWRQRRQTGARIRWVPSVQIKHVPDDVHRELRHRAAQAGHSLQEYLLELLTETARTESLEAVLERASQRTGGSLPFSLAARTLRAERQRR
jgi:plasmid stability protein